MTSDTALYVFVYVATVLCHMPDFSPVLVENDALAMTTIE